MPDARRVYAIVARDAPLPGQVGGSAVALSAVPWRALAAVTGAEPEGGTPATMQAVMHHEAIVEAVRRAAPALPVRFGTVLRDADAVAAAVAERYDALAADLARLGDKVELGLTALWGADAHDEAPDAAAHDAPREAAGTGAGARYLRARAAGFQREDARKEEAQQLVRALDERLGGLALDRRVSLAPTPRVAVRIAYLLEPADVDAFRDAVERVRGTRDDVRVLLTGPWPPYGFVGRAGTDERTGERLAALAGALTDTWRGRFG